MVRGPVIELKDVWKTYKMDSVEVNALRGLNLKIDQGDYISLIGASGSGKSTAMNMVGALDIPTKGKVTVDGKDISKLSESDLATLRGKKIGFIFQTFNLFSGLNAIENVTIAMTFQNVPSNKRLARAKELLTAVGLADRMYHRPGQMSGGERQRVAIARALANDPEIILADEPTGNLDSKNGEMVMDLLVNLHKKFKKTLVVITHELDIAKRAHKIYQLKDGVIVKCLKGCS
jgi:putative ABC transport system ATP-binding protein